MSAHDSFRVLVEHIEKDIPGFRIGYKDEKLALRDWKLWVAARTVGLFNKRFMTDYTTTLYPTVYFTSRSVVEEDPLGCFRTLCHEYVHLWDEKKRRLLFPTSYLLPQILAVFSLGALGAIWCLWFLLFLGFLGFLAPWRSPWRSRWEMRGYTMNLLTHYWSQGTVPESLRSHIVPCFTDVGAYYRMWPDAKAVRLEIDRRAKLIESGLLLEEERDKEPYEVCQAIWQNTFNK